MLTVRQNMEFSPHLGHHRTQDGRDRAVVSPSTTALGLGQKSRTLAPPRYSQTCRCHVRRLRGLGFATTPGRWHRTPTITHQLLLEGTRLRPSLHRHTRLSNMGQEDGSRTVEAV